MLERILDIASIIDHRDNSHEIISRLKIENSSLKKQIYDLRKSSAAKDEKIKLLLEENASLKRKLCLNSNNSSKPPSSDGLEAVKKIKTASRR